MLRGLAAVLGPAFVVVLASLIAMATDLAEVVGAAIGLNLLFGIPLLGAGLVVAVCAFGVLSLQLRGHRPFERAIVFLLLVVFTGFGYDCCTSARTPAWRSPA